MQKGANAYKEKKTNLVNFIPCFALSLRILNLIKLHGLSTL